MYDQPEVSNDRFSGDYSPYRRAAQAGINAVDSAVKVGGAVVKVLQPELAPVVDVATNLSHQFLNPEGGK